jgi:hypothetical protein
MLGKVSANSARRPPGQGHPVAGIGDDQPVPHGRAQHRTHIVESRLDRSRRQARRFALVAVLVCIALSVKGVAARNKAIDGARRRLVERGDLVEGKRTGRGGAKWYRVAENPDIPGTAPTTPQPRLGVVGTSPTTSYRGVVPKAQLPIDQPGALQRVVDLIPGTVIAEEMTHDEATPMGRRR